MTDTHNSHTEERNKKVVPEGEHGEEEEKKQSGDTKPIAPPVK